MADTTIQIKLKINYPVILFTVLFVHLFLLLSGGLPDFTLAKNQPHEAPTTLKIRRVKTNKVEHAMIRPMESVMDAGAQSKSSVSLKDLSISKSQDLSIPTPKIQRPGTRPEVAVRQPKTMNQISLKNKEISKAFASGGLSAASLMAGAQRVNDAVVSIEVPEGITPDELNEYELMFYGFQRRTAISYINSIMKNLDKFQRRHPNYQIPKGARITMTARINYDPEGNVKQIKMIRWTYENEMQTLFEDVVKDIDQLHNPPKALWEKNGEFAMFYTLEILNG